jgi:hypothetical protein
MSLGEVNGLKFIFEFIQISNDQSGPARYRWWHSSRIFDFVLPELSALE